MSDRGRFYAEIYGCSMNRGEAELFLGELEERGYSPVSDPDGAGVSILFTCTVIDATERRMLRAMRAMQSPLFVAGCMPSAQEDLVRRTRPDARLFPPDRYHEMMGASIEAMEGPRAAGTGDRPEVHRRARDIRRHPIGDGAVIVPIASGCAGSCTYCITRIARPNIRSRPMSELVGMVSSTEAAEVRLSAQDASAYGLDLGSSLPDLLDRLTDGEGPMLRVGMMNPATLLPVLDRTVEAFGHERVFEFLHLPVQSGSDRILLEMRRGYTVAEVIGIVDAFRTAHPGLTLSTDVIVGYPGETDGDFEATVSVLRRLEPDVLNVTRFSARPGTPAWDLESVNGGVSKERSRRLTLIHREASIARNERRVGTVTEVVITEPGMPGTMKARDPGYRPYVVPGEHPVGERLAVVVTDCTEAYLWAGPIVDGQ